jgi:hypothetical protein
VGNAQILIPAISYSPYRNPEAWEYASASGFFFGFGQAPIIDELDVENAALRPGLLGRIGSAG